MLIFAPFKIYKGHEAAAPNKAAYFVPVCKKHSGNRVGKWKHPQGITYLVEPEQRVVPHFYLFKIYKVMEKKEWEKKMDERQAAHLLMVEFVKANADVVASALEPIVGLWHEVTYDTLKDNVGVVSQVFAGVALELIDHNSALEPEDEENMVLPVGAKTMSHTINDLSKFIDSTRWLFRQIIEKYDGHPALEMAQRVFYNYEAQM